MSESKRATSPAAWATQARRTLHDPSFQTDALQVSKTVAAAVIAWVAAVHAFHLQQPFLAPWAALLTVHATVYRTVSRGIQQVGATVFGVVLAFGMGSLIGVNVATIACTLLVALTVGGASVFRAEGMTVATTALIVLTTGYAEDTDGLVSRLLDTGIGIICGVLINLAVYPPLAHRSAARRVEKIDDGVGALLTDMADAIREGYDQETVEAMVERTRVLEGDIEGAWSVVSESIESRRFNPRRTARRVGARVASYSDVLHRLEQAVAEVRSMAQTLGVQAHAAHTWNQQFRREWVSLLADAGAAVTDADPEAVAHVRRRLADLVHTMSTRELPGMHWPDYGALVTNLRNIVEAMEDVAAAQPQLAAS
ncbi:MAG: FUSC family protein [Nocardioidaceae bacterium]